MCLNTFIIEKGVSMEQGLKIQKGMKEVLFSDGLLFVAIFLVDCAW